MPVLAAAGGAILLAGCTSCQSTVRTTAMTVIAGGSFDVVVADQPGQRLYLADRAAKGVDVVDISSPQPVFLTTIPLTAAPHGLALDTASHRLFAALGSGAVAVIDTGPRSSNQVVANIQVESSSLDLIDYSAETDSLYVGSDRTVLVVDVARQQVTKRITTAMPVGQPRYDPADGMVYATVSGTDSLVQIDPATGFVTRSYVIAKCRPNGVGINPARQLALVSCGGSIALVNLESGAQRVTRVVQGGDVVTYEAAADRFVVASPHDMDESAIGVFAGDGSFIGSVPATSSAHAAAFDSVHGLVYAPGPAGLMSFAPAACAPPPDGCGSWVGCRCSPCRCCWPRCSSSWSRARSPGAAQDWAGRRTRSCRPRTWSSSASGCAPSRMGSSARASPTKASYKPTAATKVSVSPKLAAHALLGFGATAVLVPAYTADL